MVCNEIVMWKPDIVITEKGISDLAQHFLLKRTSHVSEESEKQIISELQEFLCAKIVN